MKFGFGVKEAGERDVELGLWIIHKISCIIVRDCGRTE